MAVDIHRLFLRYDIQVFFWQFPYGFNQKNLGLTFPGCLVGFILATVTFGILGKTLYLQAKVQGNG